MTKLAWQRFSLPLRLSSLAACTLAVFSLSACEGSPAPCGEGLVAGSDGRCVPAETHDTCGEGTVLKAGVCVPAGGDPDSSNPGSSDHDAGGTADAGEGPDGDAACTPNCDNKQCGDNGCGGSCGGCAGVGATCGTDGICQACQPQCDDKECGHDGCGGSCGSCSGHVGRPSCSAAGLCVGVCTPDCTDSECGPDGCGNLCGTCGAGLVCFMHHCDTLPAENSCKGQCGKQATGGSCSCTSDCKVSSTCCADFKAACPCIPQCTNKQCGDDGCGGSCGTGCKSGEFCSVAGACDSDKCTPTSCSGHGTCTPSDGSCACSPGFSGAKCDTCAAGFAGYPGCAADPCLNQVCGEGGSCDAKTGACVCKPGFTGLQCDACKFDAETFPKCSCSGTTCAACTTGGCDDGNPCTKDDCDLSGACVHLSACAYGKLSAAISGALVGPVTATAAAPVKLTIAGTKAIDVSVWREGGPGAFAQASAPGTAQGGTFSSVSGPDLTFDGGLPLLSVMPAAGKLNKGKVKLKFSAAATSLGSGHRYVLIIGGLGGAGEGPLGIATDQLFETAGTLAAWPGGTPGATFINQAVIGASGGQPSALRALVLGAATQAVTLEVDQLDGSLPDTFVLGVAVAEMVSQCNVAAKNCVTPGPVCGDGVMAGAEACDDGNLLDGDGCSKSCKVEAGYTCTKLHVLSSCGETCKNSPECAHSRVYWNRLDSLDGKTETLQLDGVDSELTFGVLVPVDGKPQAVGVTLSAHSAGAKGAPKTLSIKSQLPPKSVNGIFTDPGSKLTFGWKGGIPLLNLPSNGPWATTLRMQFTRAANQLGPEYRIIVGIAGTAGPAGEGPVTVKSSLPLTDFGSLDGFGSGKLPALKDAKTLVGSKASSGVVTDGYRFVALPADAKSIELAITSPAADTHGYVVGVAQIRKRDCLSGKCVAALKATCGNGVLEPNEPCDDGAAKAGDGCSATCAIETGWVCTPGPQGSTCTKPACVPSCAGKQCGSNGCGGSCGACNDGNGCTTDACSPAGLCLSHPACSTGQVVWNDLNQLKGKLNPVASKPLAIPLGTPKPTTAKLWRTDGAPVSPFQAPAIATNGKATPVPPLGIPLSWVGPLNYINIDNAAGKLMSGAVVVDFGQAASTSGAGWRYFVGVAALGYPNNGPMTITSSLDLQEVATFDAWKHPKGASWNPKTKTLTGPNGGKNTQMQFFLLPANALQLQLALAQPAGAGADTFGFFLGAVNLGESCQGSGPTAKCVAAPANCGDGVVAIGEACDDGNTKGGDGCSATCAEESGFVCAAPVLTTMCAKGTAGHPCDGAGMCGSNQPPSGLSCYCDGVCKQQGDCCAADGSKSATCKGATCKACL